MRARITRALIEREGFDFVAVEADWPDAADQNARLVANAEKYYRVMYSGSVSSWNLRDQHIFDTLRTLLGVYGSHARGEHNVGALVRAGYGDRSYLIGFGTHTGTVAATGAYSAGGRRAAIAPNVVRAFTRSGRSPPYARAGAPNGSGGTGRVGRSPRFEGAAARNCRLGLGAWLASGAWPASAEPVQATATASARRPRHIVRRNRRRVRPRRQEFRDHLLAVRHEENLAPADLPEILGEFRLELLDADDSHDSRESRVVPLRKGLARKRPSADLARPVRAKRVEAVALTDSAAGLWIARGAPAIAGPRLTRRTAMMDHRLESLRLGKDHPRKRSWRKEVILATAPIVFGMGTALIYGRGPGRTFLERVRRTWRKTRS